jgi:hypothetical protein
MGTGRVIGTTQCLNNTCKHVITVTDYFCLSSVCAPPLECDTFGDPPYCVTPDDGSDDDSPTDDAGDDDQLQADDDNAVHGGGGDDDRAADDDDDGGRSNTAAGNLAQPAMLAVVACFFLALAH